MIKTGEPSQRQAIQLLQRSLRLGRLGHAYLFCGQSLVALENFARELAKTLNCQDPSPAGPSDAQWAACNRCRNCQRIDKGNHPDVHWIRPESKSRVIIIDQIRELMATIYLKPAEAAHKAGIILAADRMNIQAANAFLKTLEEPPSNSVLILISTEPQRILQTILSRCLRINLGGPPATRTESPGWMGAFSKMAALEKGLMGRYRLLGILLAKLNQIKAETEQSLRAGSRLEQHEEIDSKLRERWEDELSAAIEAEYRHQRADLLLVLQAWLRDIWLETLGVAGDLAAFTDLQAAARKVAARLSPAEAMENLEIVNQAQGLLNSNVQEALALEVCFLKLKLGAAV